MALKAGAKQKNGWFDFIPAAHTEPAGPFLLWETVGKPVKYFPPGREQLVAADGA